MRNVNLSPLVRRVLSSTLAGVVVFAICAVLEGPGFVASVVALMTFGGMMVGDPTSPGSDTTTAPDQPQPLYGASEGPGSSGRRDERHRRRRKKRGG